MIGNEYVHKLTRVGVLCNIFIFQGHFNCIVRNGRDIFDVCKFFCYHDWVLSLCAIGLATNVVDSMTFKIASIVSKLVKQAIPCSTDRRRIMNPSERGCFPEVNVFTTNWTAPSSIMEATFGSAEPIFATFVIGIP